VSIFQKRSRQGPLAVLLVSLVAVLACSAETRRKTLKVFFDGVPDRTESTYVEEASDPIAVAFVRSTPDAPARPLLQLSIEPPPPRWESSHAPLEAIDSWEQALEIMPTDDAHGVDWVRAATEGLIAPKFVPPKGGPLEPPYTLDTIALVSSGFPDRPLLDLDLQLVPEGKPFFAARFPHKAHTFWLNCSSCHPQAAEMRTDMDRILAGEACGKCHGKVAFQPEMECARCHEKLVPAKETIVAKELSRALKAPPPATPEATARGQEVYQEYCSFCHGESGDGQGRFAPYLATQPRDFTTGKYKFRSTIGTAPPTDVDIFGTITRGVPGTSMPAWQALDYDDRWALVHYIKTFADRFAEQEIAEPILIPEPPEFTEELLALGKDMYKQAGCNACHGDSGDGNGPSAPTLQDDAGNSIRPFNFASGRPMKSAWSPAGTYRVVMTGLPGTPMPGFGEVLAPRMAWALAAHVESLRGTAKAPFAVRGDILFERQEIPPEEIPRLATTDLHSLTPEELAADELFLLAGKDIPPATFPHWFHRIRFKCSSCHESVFRMEAGSNPITMTAMRRGEFCANCHNGEIAWEIGFPTCVRCHVAR